MGESYFEVVFTQEPQQIKEVCRYNYFQRPLGMIMLCLIGLMELILLWGALQIWKESGFHFADLSIVFPGLVFFALYYGLYCLQVKVHIKRLYEQGSGHPLQCRMAFYPDVVHFDDSNGTHLSLPYGNIQWSTMTANLFLMRTKAWLIYPFPKAAFTKGQPEYFLSFLASRGVKVK